MKSLEERVRRGHEAIVKAKAEGKDASKWEEHLADLEWQLVERNKGTPLGQGSKSSTYVAEPIDPNDLNLRVKVKMGAFGFCTCSLEKALCTGCWRVKEACKCREMEVNPEEEITQRYAQFLKWINTPLRR